MKEQMEFNEEYFVGHYSLDEAIPKPRKVRMKGQSTSTVALQVTYAAKE